jgi:DNA-binding NarL/FixJ family response regulator
LSHRELEVAYLVAQGYAKKNIALRLGISEETVKRYMSNICEKLGFSNRIELALRVLRENFFFYQYQRSPAAR